MLHFLSKVLSISYYIQQYLIFNKLVSYFLEKQVLLLLTIVCNNAGLVAIHKIEKVLCNKRVLKDV